MNASLKTTFVLIDFENVQPKNVELLHGGPFKIKVFVGASQSKVPLAMAKALQVFGPDVEYIQIDGNGSNALDFHIAYYIGMLSAEFPKAEFHIVSKDTGFDPLVKHLKQRQIVCRRTASIADAVVPKVSNAKPLPERVDAVIESLIKQAASRPRTAKTLSSSIKALFVNRITDAEVADIVSSLTQRGKIAVSGTKVSYQLP